MAFQLRSSVASVLHQLCTLPWDWLTLARGWAQPNGEKLSVLVIWKLLWDASPLRLTFREPIPACHRLWSPAQGWVLISSFFQESEEERWRDDTEICYLTPGLHGPTALALAMTKALAFSPSDQMEQFQIPVGTPKSHGPAELLPWPQQPQLWGSTLGSACPACGSSLCLHRAMCVWKSRCSASPPPERALQLLLRWKILTICQRCWPCHATPFPAGLCLCHKSHCKRGPALSADQPPLQLSWERGGLWDSSLSPSTGSTSQRLCPQSHFQITLQREELSPTQPAAEPPLHLFKQHSCFWCFSHPQPHFSGCSHNDPSFRGGDTSFLMSCVVERHLLQVQPLHLPCCLLVTPTSSHSFWLGSDLEGLFCLTKIWRWLTNTLNGL